MLTMFILIILFYQVPTYLLLRLFDRMELEGSDLQIGMIEV